MSAPLTALYAANAVFLTVHEIDSAYWHEWDLLRIPGGRRAFLLLHVPLIALILFGLLQLHDETRTGFVISLVLSASGLLAFVLHATFIARGRPEFRDLLSLAILALTLIVSLIQGVVTITEW